MLRLLLPAPAVDIISGGCCCLVTAVTPRRTPDVTFCCSLNHPVVASGALGLLPEGFLACPTWPIALLVTHLHSIANMTAALETTTSSSSSSSSSTLPSPGWAVLCRGWCRLPLLRLQGMPQQRQLQQLLAGTTAAAPQWAPQCHPWGCSCQVLALLLLDPAHQQPVPAVLGPCPKTTPGPTLAGEQQPHPCHPGSNSPLLQAI
jgi:hypothetical protein